MGAQTFSAATAGADAAAGAAGAGAWAAWPPPAGMPAPVFARRVMPNVATSISRISSECMQEMYTRVPA